MSLFVVDVESDGPIPGDYSMVCFGAVLVSEGLDQTFYGLTRPMTEKYVPEALAVSGFSREEHASFDDPAKVMAKFKEWLHSVSKNQPVFVSDNVAFDWQFINYYFHHFLGENPFGYSGRRIGDLYSGLTKDMRKASEWKKMRRTTHTHNPVDDAVGNAEALLQFKTLGLNFPA